MEQALIAVIVVVALIGACCTLRPKRRGNCNCAGCDKAEHCSSAKTFDKTDGK